MPTATHVRRPREAGFVAPVVTPAQLVEDVLASISDRGVVSLDPDTTRVLSDAQRHVIAPVDRWAIFIVSHVIIAAFELPC